MIAAVCNPIRSAAGKRDDRASATTSPPEDFCVGPGDHRAQCYRCAAEFFLDVEASKLGPDFECSRLGLTCFMSSRKGKAEQKQPAESDVVEAPEETAGATGEEGSEHDQEDVDDDERL